jgi:hypothetical protein
LFTNRLLCLGASAGALSLRGSGCRNLALPGVYEQASTLFPASYPTSLLQNLTHTSHPWLAAGAVVVHTLGHLFVAGFVAMLVYEKLGVRILQRAWFNFDFAWAVALIATGLVTIPALALFL